jgi:hypothetical protein
MGPRRLDEATTVGETLRRGEYGRIVRPDGTEQWWVRSARGTWITLSHQRVIENDDGSITLLSLT